MEQQADTNALSRRKFLRTAGLSGTALFLGFYFPLAANAGRVISETALNDVEFEIEMNAWIIAQASCCVEHHNGIVGEAEIAGQADHQLRLPTATEAVVGRDGAIGGRQQCPVWDEMDFLPRHTGIGEQQRRDVAADGDDRIEPAEQYRVGPADQPRRQR